MLGKINWPNLLNYTVQPGDMQLFQNYLFNYSKELILGSRTKGIVYGARISIVSGLQIKISPGLAFFPDGQLVQFDELSIALDSADASNPRKDRIELRYVQTNNTNVVDANNQTLILDQVFTPSLQIIKGTASALQVVQPATPANISLGVVEVGVSQLTLNPSNIDQDEDSNFDTSSIVLGNKNSYIRFNQKSSILQFSNDGVRYQALGSGGGGGGGGANWQPVSGLAPVEDFEFDEKVWLFEKDALQSLVLWVKIPSSYLSGSQILLKSAHYSPSASDNFKFSTTATLVRRNIDSIDSSANSHVSTNSDVPNTLSKKYIEVEYDLTDSSGQINGFAVSGGDLLKIVLTRVPTAGTEDVENIRMIPSATEVIV